MKDVIGIFVALVVIVLAIALLLAWFTILIWGYIAYGWTGGIACAAIINLPSFAKATQEALNR